MSSKLDPKNFEEKNAKLLDYIEENKIIFQNKFSKIEEVFQKIESLLSSMQSRVQKQEKEIKSLQNEMGYLNHELKSKSNKTNNEDSLEKFMMHYIKDALDYERSSLQKWSKKEIIGEVKKEMAKNNQNSSQMLLYGSLGLNIIIILCFVYFIFGVVE